MTSFGQRVRPRFLSPKNTRTRQISISDYTTLTSDDNQTFHNRKDINYKNYKEDKNISSLITFCPISNRLRSMFLVKSILFYLYNIFKISRIRIQLNRCISRPVILIIHSRINPFKLACRATRLKSNNNNIYMISTPPHQRPKLSIFSQDQIYGNIERRLDRPIIDRKVENKTILVSYQEKIIHQHYNRLPQKSPIYLIRNFPFLKKLHKQVLIRLLYSFELLDSISPKAFRTFYRAIILLIYTQHTILKVIERFIWCHKQQITGRQWLELLDQMNHKASSNYSLSKKLFTSIIGGMDEPIDEVAFKMHVVRNPCLVQDFVQMMVSVDSSFSLKPQLIL